MRSIRDYLNKPVIEMKTGERLGFSKNILINNKKKTVAAIIMLQDERWYTGVKLFPYTDIVSAGNAIIIKTENLTAPTSAAAKKNFGEIINVDVRLLNTKVLTQYGTKIGKIVDVLIDEVGAIKQCIILPGEGKVVITAENIITMLKDIVITNDNNNNKIIEHKITTPKEVVFQPVAPAAKKIESVVEVEQKTDKMEDHHVKVEDEKKSHTENLKTDNGIVNGYNFGFSASNIKTSNGVDIANIGDPITIEMIKTVDLLGRLKYLFIPSDQEIEITEGIREKINRAKELIKNKDDVEYEP